MDITPLFKACVKTVRTRNKTLGGMGVASAEKRRTDRPRCVFSCTARDLTVQMTRLRDLLLENCGAYLSNVSAVAATSGAGDDMSEEEREQLDAGAHRLLHSCAAELRDFKARFSKMTSSAQTREHMNAVIELLESYLKSVCKIHSEIKALRVKRALDVRKLSRLEPTGSRIDIAIEQDIDDETKRIIEEETVDLSPEELQVMSTHYRQACIRNGMKVEEAAEVCIQGSWKMLQSENAELHAHLDSLSEEVKHIESTVLHIAQLQEVFTEKVLQQESEVERVAGSVLGATENVKDANEQIRRAIQRNAGLRVYVLFFLLVMSFSLLFLDWYND